MLATNSAGRVLSRLRRVGGAHLGVVEDSVNGFLQFYFKFAYDSQNSAIFEGFFLGSPVRVSGVPRGRPTAQRQNRV